VGFHRQWALFPADSSAGVNTWTTSGPEGGIVSSLAIDLSAPATLYAGTYGGGVFRFVLASPDRQPVQRPLQKPPTRAVTPRR
jgi:hypothetical protein